MLFTRESLAHSSVYLQRPSVELQATLITIHTTINAVRHTEMVGRMWILAVEYCETLYVCVHQIFTTATNQP